MPEIQNRGVYRFALATCCCIVLLLMAGGMVTSNNAADSVPDWPLAYGRWIPPLIGGIRFEYAHRVIAGVISIMTLVVAVWIAFTETRRLARRLGWTALGLVIAQAVLGGLRVLDGYPAITGTAHAILAQIFFVTVVGLTAYISPWWRSDLPQLEDVSSPSVRSVTAWTTAVIFVQLILGAGFRHGAFGILPHLIGAGAVTVFVVWAGRVVRKRFENARVLRRGVTMLHAFFGVQILLGGAAYWAVTGAANTAQPGLLYVTITVAHVLFGALLLASSLLLTLWCFRLVRPAESAAPNLQAECSPRNASV